MAGEDDKGGKPDMPEISTSPTNPDDRLGDVKVVGDADPAFDFTAHEVVEYTAEEERGVLRKIDWYLLPLLCWVYAVQFADKTTLNYASLMGIRQDAHLKSNSQEYSWASSIFYAGYIAYE